jgi:hypothetical protein
MKRNDEKNSFVGYRAYSQLRRLAMGRYGQLNELLGHLTTLFQLQMLYSVDTDGKMIMKGEITYYAIWPIVSC